MDKELLEAVRGPAQSFTYRGKHLSFANPNFPLAVFADGYVTPIVGNGEPINNEAIASIEEHFENTNQTETDITKDTREVIINNTHVGVAQLQFNAHNVLIPAIKAMCKSYSELFNTAIQPDISVDSFNFTEPHNNPEFVNHVSESYANIHITPHYKTFLLESMDVEAVIDHVANNNKHFSREFLTEWSLTLGAERIRIIWDSLFAKDRQVNLAEMPFLKLGLYPLNTDDIAFAYFLLAALRDEPLNNVIGESVTIEEWTTVFANLHAAFGKILLNTYERRALAKSSGELVVSYDSERAVERRKVHVVLNGDVANEWLQNNNIEAILGAAVSNRNIRTVEVIEPVKDKLMEVWNRTYPLIRQSALDKANVNRRVSVVKAFMDNADTLSSLVEPESIQAALDQSLAKCAITEYENHFLLFTKLVCEVSGSDYIYQEYLQAIDEYSQVFPEASANELETQALITVIALYMAKQITAVNYTPDIVQDAPEASEEPVEEESEEVEGDVQEEEENASEEPVEDSEEEEVETPAEDESETSEPETESEDPEETNESQDLMSELDEMDESSKE